MDDHPRSEQTYSGRYNQTYSGRDNLTSSPTTPKLSECCRSKKEPEDQDAKRRHPLRRKTPLKTTYITGRHNQVHYYVRTVTGLSPLSSMPPTRSSSTSGPRVGEILFGSAQFRHRHHSVTLVEPKSNPKRSNYSVAMEIRGPHPLMSPEWQAEEETCGLVGEGETELWRLGFQEWVHLGKRITPNDAYLFIVIS